MHYRRSFNKQKQSSSRAGVLIKQNTRTEMTEESSSKGTSVEVNDDIHDETDH